MKTIGSKNNLTIVAKIEAKESKASFVKAELQKLIEATRLERGCLQYDLHQDNSDPNQFLFFENWDTRENWLAHMESEHIQNYMKATEGFIESFALNEMTYVD